MTTVLLPRPAGSDGDADGLERHGVKVIADPYIVTTVREDDESAAERIRMAEFLPAAALVITSRRALSSFIEHCSVPRASVVYAIGSASAAAALEAGFTDVRWPDDGAHTDALVRRIAQDRPSDVVIPRSAAASSSLVFGLRELGIRVHTAVLYDTAVVDHEPASTTALRKGSIDAVVVRSGSAARALAAFVPDWPVATRIVAGGIPTAAVLRELGLPVDAISDHPDASTVVATTLKMLGLGGSDD